MPAPGTPCRSAWVANPESSSGGETILEHLAVGAGDVTALTLQADGWLLVVEGDADRYLYPPAVIWRVHLA